VSLSVILYSRYARCRIFSYSLFILCNRLFAFLTSDWRLFLFGNPLWKPDADGAHVVSFFWFSCKDYLAALLRRRWRPYGELYPRRSFPLSSSCRVTWYHLSLHFVHRGGYPFLTKRGHCYLSRRTKGLNLNVANVQVWYVAVNLTSRAQPKNSFNTR